MTDNRTPQPSPSPGLEQAVTAALRLIVTGHRPAAIALLRPHLQTLDPAGDLPDPALIDASTLFATLTTGPDQLRAARYAYRASHQLYPCGHPRRLAAADAYGTALHQHGHLDEAILVRRRLLIGYRIHQPQNTLPAAVAYADSLHAALRCTEALAAVSKAWDIWRQHPHGGLTTGTSILHTFIRMLRSCRRDLDLIALLSQARDTPVWDHLVLTHTTAAAAADTTYIDTHRHSSCDLTPQRLSDGSPGPAPAVPSPVRPGRARRSPATGRPTAEPQDIDRTTGHHAVWPPQPDTTPPRQLTATVTPPPAGWRSPPQLAVVLLRANGLGRRLATALSIPCERLPVLARLTACLTTRREPAAVPPRRRHTTPGDSSETTGPGVAP